MPKPRPTVEKFCPKCKDTKKVEEFYSSDKYDGGFSPWCMKCHRNNNNERRHLNRERTRETSRRSYWKHKEKNAQANRDRSKAANVRLKVNDPAKYRAKKFFDSIYARESVANDVTREYLTELFRSVTHCQCCGVLLELEFRDLEERRASGRIWNARSPSVDRVNNDKGYTRNNIAIICWECNHRKTDLTLKDLAMFETYIRRFGDV